MMRSITHQWPLLTLIALVLCLVTVGILWLDVPPIYRIAHHAPFMVYRSYAALGVAVLLVCAHRWIINKMLWLSGQMHRWLSALFMFGFVGVDAAMHLLNIPHMEGWWIPLLGGGMVSSIIAWIKAISKRASL